MGVRTDVALRRVAAEQLALFTGDIRTAGTERLRVDGSGKVGFLIEDGMVKAVDGRPVEAPAA